MKFRFDKSSTKHVRVFPSNKKRRLPLPLINGGFLRERRQYIVLVTPIDEGIESDKPDLRFFQIFAISYN